MTDHIYYGYVLRLLGFVLLLHSITAYTTLAQVVPEDQAKRVVDQQPSYVVGGLPGFYLFVQQNLKYPVASRTKCHQGILYVHFIVRKNGELDSVYALNSIDEQIDAEAQRVVRLSSGTWQPGEVDQQPVNVRLVLPITFQIGGTCQRRVQRAIRRGSKQYGEENYAEAIAQFDKALSMEPSNTTALIQKGKAHLQLEQIEEACAMWEQVLLSEKASNLKKQYCDR